MTLGEKIIYARKKAGMSAAHLALRVGISKSFMSKIEKNKSAMMPEVMKKMADILNVPLDFFLNSAVLTLDELEVTQSAKELLTDPEAVAYIAVAQKARQKGFSVEELEKAIKFIEDIKKES